MEMGKFNGSILIQVLKCAMQKSEMTIFRICGNYLHTLGCGRKIKVSIKADRVFSVFDSHNEGFSVTMAAKCPKKKKWDSKLWQHILRYYVSM